MGLRGILLALAAINTDPFSTVPIYPIQYDKIISSRNVADLLIGITFYF